MRKVSGKAPPSRGDTGELEVESELIRRKRMEEYASEWQQHRPRL